MAKRGCPTFRAMKTIFASLFEGRYERKDPSDDRLPVVECIGPCHEMPPLLGDFDRDHAPALRSAITLLSDPQTNAAHALITGRRLSVIFVRL